jgi:HD-GYP domain-containing protein (c-di-GMP phosphodiesterase class II)
MVEIIAACDVYDALHSPRPYRTTPYDNRTALEEITEMAQGGKLSWEVVQLITIGAEIINVFGPSMYPHRACKMRSGLHS